MSQSIAVSCCAAVAAFSLLLTGCGGESSAHGEGGHGSAPKSAPGGGGHGAAKKSAPGAAKSSHGGGHGAAKSGGHGGGHGAAKPAPGGSAKSSHGSGHGQAAKGDAHGQADTHDLLEGLRRTPEESVEIDLGTFTVARHLSANSTMRVKFQIIGLVDQRQEAEFAEALAARQQSMRDRVLEQCLKLDLEHFDDPTLRALKSELLVEIQRAVRSLALHEVLVCEFIMERR